VRLSFAGAGEFAERVRYAVTHHVEVPGRHRDHSQVVDIRMLATSEMPGVSDAIPDALLRTGELRATRHAARAGSFEHG
jgi:hypothetical protein